jgi:hypothetical protein
MNHHLRQPDSTHVNLRMERWQRRAVYAVLIMLAGSGMVWLLAHYLLRSQGEFGETVHPLEPWSMKLHGAAAMAALFFIGSMINSHIRRAQRAGRNLVAGWVLIAALAALTVTGYGLWYIAGEDSRGIWSMAHWLVGLAFPVLLVWHIAHGRSLRRKRSVPSPGTHGLAIKTKTPH